MSKRGKPSEITMQTLLAYINDAERYADLKLADSPWKHLLDDALFAAKMSIQYCEDKDETD